VGAGACVAKPASSLTPNTGKTRRSGGAFQSAGKLSYFTNTAFTSHFAAASRFTDNVSTATLSGSSIFSCT
jgi:hypothetical protein